MEINGKVAIITGASSGIGKALAFELSKNQTIVILAARNQESLFKIKNDIINAGGTAHYILTDVTSEEDCKNLIEETVKLFGRIDILINNAGISMRANFNELNLSVIKRVMDANFYGTVYCTKYALPYLIESKGLIIGISSISGLTPLPGRTGYCASKHAMVGFLNSLRLELKIQGVKVMTVFPGFTSSEIRKKALNKDGNEQGESPRKEEKMMSSEDLTKIIIQGIKKNKREIITTFQGKITVWFYKRFPGFTDKFILKTIKKEPKSPKF